MRVGALAICLTAMITIPTIASAGEAVWGVGDTRSDALRDAEARAKEIARAQGTCITPPKPSDCSKDEGGWKCVVYVANHIGSC